MKLRYTSNIVDSEEIEIFNQGEMEYVRNKFLQFNRDGVPGEKSYYDRVDDKSIVIHPGQVEEAIHRASIPGRISLEELRFWSYVPDPHEHFGGTSIAGDSSKSLGGRNTNKNLEVIKNKYQRETQDSYLDVVVFEIPMQCESSPDTLCDLPSHGIGSIVDDRSDENIGIPHPTLKLCNETTGRLVINDEIFEGYHTNLHIPPSGYIMKDRITDPRAHKIPSFPSQNSQFEILIANCDTHVYGTGRNIELSGEILFESDSSLQAAAVTSAEEMHVKDDRSHKSKLYRYHIGTKHQIDNYGKNQFDLIAKLKLVGLGLFVCLFFSLASCKIHWGTRTDYLLARRNISRRRRSNRNNRYLDDPSSSSNSSSEENSILDSDDEYEDEEA